MQGGFAIKYLRRSLIILGLFNVVDYLVTNRSLQQGFVEGNPLMHPIVNTHWFFVIKVILIPGALYFICRVRHKIGKIVVTAVCFTTGIYTLLMLYFGVLIVRGEIVL